MAETEKSNETVYEFGQFRLSPAERLLLRGEEPVALPPKVFDTLVALVESGGHLIEKDALLEKIWADTFVEEATLARNISLLRKALGEGGADERRFIATVPRRGYRFLEPVRRVTDGETATAGEPLPETLDENPFPEKREAARKSPAKTRRPLLRLLLPLALAGVLLTSLSLWNSPPVEKQPLSRIRSIAVLPFKPIGPPEQRDETLELGMADALITRLSNVRQIVVRPTATIARFHAAEADAAQIGRDLQVEAVLVGSIQRSGDRVRVTAQLVNAADGSPLWAEAFDARFTDIFAVQDSISAQAAAALAARLSGDERARLSKNPTENAEAYQLFLKGRYFLEKRSPNNLTKAIDYFTQAIVLDAGFAAAYAGLADAYALQVSHTYVSPSENLAKARSAAERALQLDETLADAHASLGHILTLSWDWRGAEKAFARSLELNPNLPQARQWYAIFLSSQARHDEAIAMISLARELDPTSVPISQNTERAFYFAGRYDEALAASEKTLELNPNAFGVNSWREMILARKGMHDDAMETRFKGMEKIGLPAEEIDARRRLYRASGWRAYWRRELEEMRARAAKQYVSPYHFARGHARAGDDEQALIWLERSAEEHSDHLTLLKVDPIFDSLRGDPRFQDLLRRIGLE